MLTGDESLLLDRLTLAGGHVAVAPAANGVRRARARGAGLEFHENRPYQPGDDPRTIDWMVEARLRQLVVRTTKAQGHLRLHVLVDVSRSMSLGKPTKLECAKGVAAALCYVAVEHRDAAGIATFRSHVRTRLAPAEGRVQLFRTLQLLEGLEADGRSALDSALQEYAAVAAGPGLVAVLSDFFEPGAGLRGLQYLLHRGLTPVVIQIVAREELFPDLPEDAALVDVEDDSRAPLPVDPGLLDAYQARLAAHAARLGEFCAAHRCAMARVRSDMTFREQLTALQACGLLGTSA